MAQQTELVVRKEIVVRCSIGRAFEVFTAGIDSWWPRESHSVSTSDCVAVALEPRAGGRVFETARDGSEHEWGRVTTWEPPSLLAFTWHPGRDASTAGEVIVRFAAIDAGTRVTLEHRGFEKMDDPHGAFESYTTGWGLVVGERYRAAAGAA
jgi:uncharacterized protein YndB with AHSA1/START domain